jgi:hypothetical protein
LEQLSLQGNQLCSEARAVLAATARSLPLLERIRLMDDDEEPCVPAERTALLERLNSLAERDVFK